MKLLHEIAVDAAGRVYLDGERVNNAIGVRYEYVRPGILRATLELYAKIAEAPPRQLLAGKLEPIEDEL